MHDESVSRAPGASFSSCKTRQEAGRRTYVQLASAKPDILALGASLAPLCDEFPRGDLLSGDVFEPSCGDPTWGMLRIGLGEGLQECAGTLDIAADGFAVCGQKPSGCENGGRDHRNGGLTRSLSKS